VRLRSGNARETADSEGRPVLAEVSRNLIWSELYSPKVSNSIALNCFLAGVQLFQLRAEVEGRNYSRQASQWFSLHVCKQSGLAVNLSFCANRGKRWTPTFSTSRCQAVVNCRVLVLLKAIALLWKICCTRSVVVLCTVLFVPDNNYSNRPDFVNDASSDASLPASIPDVRNWGSNRGTTVLVHRWADVGLSTKPFQRLRRPCVNSRVLFAAANEIRTEKRLRVFVVGVEVEM